MLSDGFVPAIKYSMLLEKNTCQNAAPGGKKSTKKKAGPPGSMRLFG